MAIKNLFVNDIKRVGSDSVDFTFAIYGFMVTVLSVRFALFLSKIKIRIHWNVRLQSFSDGLIINYVILEQIKYEQVSYEVILTIVLSSLITTLLAL